MPARRIPIEEKMVTYVSPEPNTGCWLWLGTLSCGYGKVRHRDKMVPAHRVAWELANGPIPDGLVIDHLCRVRACVNPDHLRVVTNRENVLCGIGLAAKHAKAQVCSNGHPFDEANTHIVVNDYGYPERKCRACDREAKRAYRSAKRNPFMTILESLREMLDQANKAHGLPAEMEVRVPEQVMTIMCKEAVKHRDKWHGEVVIAGPSDGGPYPGLRCFTEWGALYIRPLDATSPRRER